MSSRYKRKSRKLKGYDFGGDASLAMQYSVGDPLIQDPNQGYVPYGMIGYGAGRVLNAFDKNKERINPIDYGENALTMAGQGAMVGSLFGPVGTGIGAVVGAGAGLAKTAFEEKAEKRNRQQSIKQHNTYAANPYGLAYGGPIPISSVEGGNGQTDSVDANSAMLDDGEEVYDGYVFSKRLGFASKAKNLKNKYKFRLGKDFDNPDPYAKKSMINDLETLKQNQEQVRQQLGLTDQQQQNGVHQMPDGSIMPDSEMQHEQPMMVMGGSLEYPPDYSQFESYSRTAPENRQIPPDYKYGDPTQYDAYGLWDALGKPKNWNEALKNNPDWKPDEYDGTYHGFSVNPRTGQYLKGYTPGNRESGNSIWMEYQAQQLSGDDWGAKNYTTVLGTNGRLQTPHRAEGGQIYIKPSKRGSFTRWAKEHGMSVKEATGRVLANKDKYSPAIVKKANFSRNFGGNELGGYVNNMTSNEISLLNDVNKDIRNLPKRQYGGPPDEPPSWIPSDVQELLFDPISNVGRNISWYWNTQVPTWDEATTYPKSSYTQSVKTTVPDIKTITPISKTVTPYTPTQLQQQRIQFGDLPYNERVRLIQEQQLKQQGAPTTSTSGQSQIGVHKITYPAQENDIKNKLLNMTNEEYEQYAKSMGYRTNKSVTTPKQTDINEYNRLRNLGMSDYGAIPIAANPDNPQWTEQQYSDYIKNTWLPSEINSINARKDLTQAQKDQMIAKLQTTHGMSPEGSAFAQSATTPTDEKKGFLQNASASDILYPLAYGTAFGNYLADYIGAKEQPLKFQRVKPEEVNYDPMVQNLYRQGEQAGAVGRRNIAGYGRGAGNVLSNITGMESQLAGDIGGKAAQIKMQEANTNVQMRNQAQAQNAQIQMQEAMHNYYDKQATAQQKQDARTNMAQVLLDASNLALQNEQYKDMLPWLATSDYSVVNYKGKNYRALTKKNASYFIDNKGNPHKWVDGKENPNGWENIMMPKDVENTNQQTTTYNPYLSSSKLNLTRTPSNQYFKKYGNT